MAADQSKQPDKTNGWRFDLPLPDTGSMAMAVIHAQSTMLRSMMLHQRELIDFIRHRWDADVQLLDQMSKAENMSKVIGLVAEYGQRTAVEYGDEAKKLGDVNVKLASDNFDELQKEARDLAKPVAKAVQPVASAA